MAVALSVAKAKDLKIILDRLYPDALFRIDARTNSIIVLASPTEQNAIRNVLMSLDIKDPAAVKAEVFRTTVIPVKEVFKRIAPLFPRAHFTNAHKQTFIVTANASDMTEIHALIAALDLPNPIPTESPSLPGTAFSIRSGSAKSIALAISRAMPRLRVFVSGHSIITKGSSDDTTAAKLLVEQLDKPELKVPYVVVYKISVVDAASLSDLLARSFPSLTFNVAKDLNSISVVAPEPLQDQVANAIALLDVPASSTASGSSSNFGTDFEVISLRAAIPSTAANGSSTATDIAQSVLQVLSQSAADLKISVEPNSTRLIISGSERSRNLAKTLIAQLDIAEPLVELDTRVLEIDEGSQTQLGLKFPTPALTTTYSETQPSATSSGVATPQLLKLQAITRTPLSLDAQLDFLIASNKAKILEDPRITTFSGHTASLRAGETVNVLTSIGGGTGTVATTQIQSFQTGVTLDITPVVNSEDYVTVTLHPSVNSIAGFGPSGVPNIQTRETTTTIGLKDGETLIIGGLIEDSDSRTVQKIPLLGDIPIIGRLFQDVGTTHARNELVVTVSPHIVKPGDEGSVNRLSMLPITTSRPTVSADATLPPLISSKPRSVALPINPIREDVGGISHESSFSPLPTQQPRLMPTTDVQPGAFTFGSPPRDNIVSANEAPRIFYIHAQPTTLRDSTPISLDVVTSSNVDAVTLSFPSTANIIPLKKTADGKFQLLFPFEDNSTYSSSVNVSATLVASTKSGATTSIQIPFSINR